MKVMLISSDNNKASGAFKCLLDIAVNLTINYNSDVEVILPYKGSGTELLVENNISYKIIRSYNWITGIADYEKKKERFKWKIKKILNKKAIRKISKEIKTYNPDIIHINTSWTYVAACAALKTKTPFVWHIREFLEEDQKAQIWNKKYGYSLMSKADQIIAISSSIKSKYDNILDCNINLIYDGIDEKQYFHKHKSFNDKQCDFITVGGLYPGKGQEIVIKSLHKLHMKGYNNFHYSIVGEGPEKPKLEKLIHEFDLDDNVKLCGFSSNTVNYYKNHDIFLMSSISEAFGRVTIEAMLNGLYVVGYNSAATSELLDGGKYGLLYTDEASLTNSLENIINNKIEIESIAKMGQAYAIQKYTSTINAMHIHNLYQKVIISSGEKYEK